MGAHALEYAASLQINIHHVSTDLNSNYTSQSIEIPRKNNHSSTFFGDKITTMTTPNLSKLPPTGK